MHHPDQLGPLIGLAEEKTALGHILISNSRVAGCHHKLDRWPTVTNGLGKLQPVHAPRYIDVGEDDLNVLPGFEERDGLISAASLQRIEACFLQKEDCILADQEIVLNDEDQ